MSNNNQENKQAFSEDYWKEEGGQKWLENINAVESSLIPLSEILLERAALREAEFVLDIGCGGALTSLEIARQVGPGGQVTGLDISADILSVARQRAARVPNLQLREGDAGSITLPERYFDLIFSRFGVMFFNDPIAAFKNFHKAMKPSARLVFLCWRTLDENPWMGEPAAAVFQHLPPPDKPETLDADAPGPFSFADSGRVRHILDSAGFKDINLEAVDTGMPLGTMDETVSFLMQMGPAAEVIAQASDDEKDTAVMAIRHVMTKYETADGIMPPAAAWIVTAWPQDKE